MGQLTATQNVTRTVLTTKVLAAAVMVTVETRPRKDLLIEHPL